jgi:hypothetical protein
MRFICVNCYSKMDPFGTEPVQQIRSWEDCGDCEFCQLHLANYKWWPEGDTYPERFKRQAKDNEGYN